jgi:hypothetical protein
MTIRIKLLDGETVKTERYTYESALKMKEAGEPIEVGGPQEYGENEGADPDLHGLDVWPPARTIYPQGIAVIERVPS